MKGIILISMLAIGCAGSSQTKSKVDQKAGYKDLPLDMPLSYFNGKVDLVLDVDNKCTASKEFLVSSEKYQTIGNTRFDEVRLEFIKDTLYRTILKKQHTDSDVSDLIAAYTSEFGVPSDGQTKQVGSSSYRNYEWAGTNKYITLIDHAYDNYLTIEYGSYAGTLRWHREWQACEERKKQKAQSEL